MQIDLNSRLYKYYTQMMKPHPRFEMINWVVLNGENMTVVIFEETAGKVKIKENMTLPFCEDIPHKHDDTEQISFFLGYGDTTPQEVRIKGYETLRNTNNEMGIVGEGAIQWIHPQAEHGLPVPPDLLKDFQKSGPFPEGYPEGTVLYWADIYAPLRPEYFKYWESL